MYNWGLVGVVRGGGLVFALFPELVAVDDVLPEDVGARGDAGEWVEVGLCHPDGEDCVFLAYGLSGGDAFAIVSADDFAEEELCGAGGERDECERYDEHEVVGVVDDAFDGFAHYHGEGHAPDVEGHPGVVA